MALIELPGKWPATIQTCGPGGEWPYGIVNHPSVGAFYLLSGQRFGQAPEPMIDIPAQCFRAGTVDRIAGIDR